MPWRGGVSDFRWKVAAALQRWTNFELRATISAKNGPTKGHHRVKRRR